jgi:folate-dependent phosphoribosylglycinamide formyltransferase PurN
VTDDDPHSSGYVHFTDDITQVLIHMWEGSAMKPQMSAIKECIKPVEKRTVYKDKTMEWGELTIPEKSANPEMNHEGLRILFIGSAGPGILVLDSLKRYQLKYPDRINLLALVTDMPTCSKAKISSEKRIWRFFKKSEKEILFSNIKESALSFGIPCYSGAMKCDFFRELLHAWNPEIIIMCCFGQLVDNVIFNYPTYGMYNVHPSDLAASIGIGTQPIEHTIQMGFSTTNLTFHQVSETIDGGSIIGKSPLINIKSADDSYPTEILTLYEKVCSIGGWMTLDLIGAVLDKRSRGEQGVIDYLDFEKYIPQDIKNILLAPVTCGGDNYTLPLHRSLT